MLANDGEADKSHSVYKNQLSGFLANLTFKYSDAIVVQNDYQKNKLKNKHKKKSTIIKSIIEIPKEHKTNKSHHIFLSVIH